jgi:serine/threonine-protein kinase
MIGKQLGSYEITGLLGKGGMGEVYRARDANLKRDVAIKILPDEFSRDPARVSRFQREAEVLASLNHPNIAAIYDLQKSDEMRFLVLELVEGETLAERIQRGPIPVDEALDLAMRIAEALEAAHEKSIVHRDLKPANVKIAPDGRVKVLDFGLATAAESAAPSTTLSNSPTLSVGATQAGVILGTAAYMSPEQARGKPVDKRSDIWSFGVVLYEMLTGEQLFQGDTVSDTVAAVLRHEIDWNRVPAKAQRLLRRCLERDVKLRLRDIGDMRLLLEDAPGETVASNSKSSRRWAVTGWAIAAVLLVVAGLASWSHFSVKPSDLPLVRLNVDLGPNFAASQALSPAFSAVLSPDGTKLLYRVRISDGKYALAVRSLERDKEILLPETENTNGTPFFSPDGRWIGFSAGGKMKKVDVQGGAVIELCDCGGGSGSWGEDGNVVFSPNPTTGIWTVPERGGKAQPLTVLAGREVTHRNPQVLPGAKAVLFTAASFLGNFDDANIQVLSLKTGKPKTLIAAGYFGRYVPSNGKHGHLLYVHQRTLFAVPFDPERLELLGTPQAIVNGIVSNSVGSAGRFDISTSHSGMFVHQEGATSEFGYQVSWLDSSGKTTPLIAKPAPYGNIRLSPDGQRLALSINTGKGNDLFIYDFMRDKMSQLTFSDVLNGSPVWTPDGKYLAFRSTDSMSWIRADGGGEVHSLLPGPNTPSSFSRDGKQLAYYVTNPGTGSDILMLPLDLSDPDHPKPQKPMAFLTSPVSENQPAFSPDGRWIAYRTSSGSGEQNIWVRPYPGPGGRWQISTGGASFPMWSQTTPQLFFEKDDGEIMVVDYTIKGDSFMAGNPRPWSEHHAFQPGTTINIDIAPDGKRLLILDRPAGAAQPVTQVALWLNFFDELRRQAPEGK